MMKEVIHPMDKYLRTEIFPTAFCPGCGCGTILNLYTHAIDELGINPEEIISVTGIGCSSWIPSPYFKGDTLHTTHGRPIAFATGVKVMKPEKKVVVIAGDGDLAGIGGNHLLHASRRNIGLVVILVNNLNYGMTGGQVSPTTPCGIKTTTTPFGNSEYPIDIASVVAAAGANYVARWTTFHFYQLKECIKEALNKKGFVFIEVISQCPTSYGKMTGLRTGLDFLKKFEKLSININYVKDRFFTDIEDKIVVGKIVEREREEFVNNLKKINEEKIKSLQ
ncbi:2-oxoacid:ferredoxin oxidoreductase subunit beta [candidate division KSB1 bacterium]|nr:MAG: 2-oxoacid:ferredoxin oxidoreductase subunit beta [candidate division KSB1 bacterium]